MIMTAANRNGVLSAKLEMCALFLAILSTQTNINISSAFHSHNVNVGVGRIQSPYSSTEPYRHICGSPTVRLSATNDSSDKDSEGANEEDGLGFTALPAIGASSFWDRSEDEQAYANANAYEISSSSLASQPNDNEQSNSNINSNGIIISEHTNLVSRKFKIQYTCKVCDTRNSHSVTRLAYRNGVVIAQCKGCYSRHLIADNLGWSNYIGGFDVDNGETDIEMYMENRDQEAKREGGFVGDDGYGEGKNDLVMRVGQDVFDLENILYKGQQGGTVSPEGVGKGDVAEDESSWS